MSCTQIKFLSGSHILTHNETQPHPDSQSPFVIFCTFSIHSSTTDMYIFLLTCPRLKVYCYCPCNLITMELKCIKIQNRLNQKRSLHKLALLAGLQTLGCQMLGTVFEQTILGYLKLFVGFIYLGLFQVKAFFNLFFIFILYLVFFTLVLIKMSWFFSDICD